MKAARTDNGYCCACDLIPGWIVAYSGPMDGFKKYVEESLDFYLEGRKKEGEAYSSVFNGEYEIFYEEIYRQKRKRILKGTCTE